MANYDKEISGEGISVRCNLENGKAILEWQFDCSESRINIGDVKILHLRLWDEQENVALECFREWQEEEPLQSVLLQPRLWNGTANPHLYRLEIIYKDARRNPVNRKTETFPLRSIALQKSSRDEESLFLNGELFQWKAVRYEIPNGEIRSQNIVGKCAHEESTSGWRQRQILEDLRQFADLGINSIYLGREEITESFAQMCDKLGLLWVTTQGNKLWVSGQELQVEPEGELISFLNNLPFFRGKENALLTPGNCPTKLYYLYKARFSRKPFIYMALDSLKRQESGNYSITCYSNCNRLALYSDGMLFEFQKGEEIFTFQEIPAKGPCIVLTAEGEGCSTALSVHKTFTKSSLIGDN